MHRALTSTAINVAALQRGAHSLLAVTLAFGIGAVFLVLIHKDPILAYASLWQGAAGDWPAIAESFAVTTPLLLVALGIAMSFRSGFFNIGAGGQLAVGSMTAALVGAYSHMGGVPDMALMVLAGGLAGFVWGVVPGILRAYTGASEIVTTLMLNYVALLLIDFLVTGPFNYQHLNESPPIPVSARFPSLVVGTQLSFAFVMAVLAVPIVSFVLWRTPFGFELRMAGLNPEAATAAGIATRRVAAVTLGLSGFMAGVGGAVEIGANFWNMPQDFSIQIGFDAITVSLLGGNNPWGVLVAALFLGGMLRGSTLMQATTGITAPFVQFFEAIVILCLVSVPFLLRRPIRRAVDLLKPHLTLPAVAPSEERPSGEELWS